MREARRGAVVPAHDCRRQLVDDLEHGFVAIGSADLQVCDDKDCAVDATASLRVGSDQIGVIGSRRG